MSVPETGQIRKCQYRTTMHRIIADKCEQYNVYQDGDRSIGASGQYRALQRRMRASHSRLGPNGADSGTCAAAGTAAYAMRQPIRQFRSYVMAIRQLNTAAPYIRP
eukprot:3024329-Rhodomonas_salina.2